MNYPCKALLRNSIVQWYALPINWRICFMLNSVWVNIPIGVGRLMLSGVSSIMVMFINEITIMAKWGFNLTFVHNFWYWPIANIAALIYWHLISTNAWLQLLWFNYKASLARVKFHSRTSNATLKFLFMTHWWCCNRIVWCIVYKAILKWYYFQTRFIFNKSI